MYVRYLYARCTQKSEEGVVAPGTRVTEGASKWTQVTDPKISVRTASTLNN